MEGKVKKERKSFFANLEGGILHLWPLKMHSMPFCEFSGLCQRIYQTWHTLHFFPKKNNFSFLKSSLQNPPISVLHLSCHHGKELGEINGSVAISIYFVDHVLKFSLCRVLAERSHHLKKENVEKCKNSWKRSYPVQWLKIWNHLLQTRFVTICIKS